MAGDEGREALLRATVRVVAREGLRGLTYRAVAQEAGVTHGMVTYHFGTRDALLLAAFRERARSHDAVDRMAAGAGDIGAIGRGLPATVDASSDEERYQYEMILEALRRPEYLGEVRLLYRRFTDVIEGELRLAGASRTAPLARVVFGALDGIVLQQLITGDEAATEESLARLRAMIRADIAVSKLRESFES